MAKKIILAIIILFLLGFFIFNLSVENTVDVYIDGENVSVKTTTAEDINVNELNGKICNYVLSDLDNPTTNISTLQEDIYSTCSDYGLDDVNINIDSSIGKNQIPIVVTVDGTSMLPTLRDGQTVLVNKTHNIHVGDIVVANSSEYGGIIKRVGEIKGNSIYLESDNKNIRYENINGILYEVKGITTWVDISDINGVVIEY